MSKQLMINIPNQPVKNMLPAGNKPDVAKTPKPEESQDTSGEQSPLLTAMESLVQNGADIGSIIQSHDLYKLLNLNPSELVNVDLPIIPNQMNILRDASESFLEQYKLLKNKFKRIDSSAKQKLIELQREILSNSVIVNEIQKHNESWVCKLFEEHEKIT